MPDLFIMLLLAYFMSDYPTLLAHRPYSHMYWSSITLRVNTLRDLKS